MLRQKKTIKDYYENRVNYYVKETKEGEVPADDQCFCLLDRLKKNQYDKEDIEIRLEKLQVSLQRYIEKKPKVFHGKDLHAKEMGKKHDFGILCFLYLYLQEKQASESEVETIIEKHRLFTGSEDGLIKEWDLITGEGLRTLEGHTAGVNALLHIQVKKKVGFKGLIASGSDDKTIKIWNVEPKNHILLATLDKFHEAGINTLIQGTWDKARLIIISGGDDDRVAVWDVDDCTIMYALCDQEIKKEKMKGISEADLAKALKKNKFIYDFAHENIVSFVFFKNNNQGNEQIFVTGSNDNNVKVWKCDSKKSELLDTLLGHEEPVNCYLEQEGHDGIFFTGSDDSTIRMWDITKRENNCAFEKIHKLPVKCLAQIFRVVNRKKNLDYIASGSEDKTIIIWNYVTRTAVNIIYGHSHSITRMFHLRYTTETTKLVTISDDKTVRIWDYVTNKDSIIGEHEFSTYILLELNLIEKLNVDGGSDCLTQHRIVCTGGFENLAKVWH